MSEMPLNLCLIAYSLLDHLSHQNLGGQVSCLSCLLWTLQGLVSSTEPGTDLEETAVSVGLKQDLSSLPRT